MICRLGKQRIKEWKLPKGCQVTNVSFHICGVLGINHYDALGIKQTATQKEIKEAYFQLCKKYHPDKHANDEAKAQQFLKISDAYTVLSNKTTKKEYDDRLNRKHSFSDSRYGHERWSSAYRNNPYVKQRKYYEHHQRPPWQDMYNHETQKQERRWEYDPKNYYRQNSHDRLSDYWSQYYKSRGRDMKNSGSYYGNQGQISDTAVKVFLAFIFCLLFLRFFAAFKISHSRAEKDRIALENHIKLQNEATEAKSWLDKHRGSSVETNIVQTKLEEV